MPELTQAEKLALAEQAVEGFLDAFRPLDPAAQVVLDVLLELLLKKRGRDA